MNSKFKLAIASALAFTLVSAVLMMARQASSGSAAAPPRPQGPCDIYAAAGTPCVAAHSTTRALYASYHGPLYQVMRQSDGKTLDIGVVQPTASPVPDPGGYADAAAQDAFCANTYCWISILYDQSGKGNHLRQAPRGGFSGPAMGGFNNVPLADMAPITIMGHKAYGVFIVPGMGLRWNDAKGTAVDDQAQGQYWVVDGHHYNSGCCFDYGNAETDSRDDGDGTMETTYYGNATAWYRGPAPGPWIMTDQENNLVGCVNESPNDKYCPDLPIITWRFVTATADGEPHHWRSMGGDAQKGSLSIMFDGPRIKNERSSYDPMRKQGAILLGNGGDNSVGSQGTFYEGAMTIGFPSEATQQKVQTNVVAAKYDLPRLSIAPASAVAMPPGLQTFTPLSSQETTVTFRNTTGAPVKDLQLSISVPAGWSSVVSGGTGPTKSFAGPIAPGGSVSATFRVTSGPRPFNGDLVAKASWTANGVTRTETAVEEVRNAGPVRINEFRIGAGSNLTDSFIELYNAGSSAVDISNWTLAHHPTQQPIFSSVKIPAGTKLAPGGFYLLGLSNSGLAAPARAGDATIYVRSVEGMKAGDTVEIDTGGNRETRKIVRVGTAASPPTTLWQPLPDGPVITIPAGSTNVPVTSVAGFEVGQKIALGYGATYPAVANTVEKYEVATVTAVGKPGTQAWLSMDAKPGDTNIKVSSVANISVGDKIRLDIDSPGHGIETVTVTRVGTASVRSTFNGPLRPGEDPGTGLDLAEPLKFHHSSNMPFSVRGTGISFQPATAFPHSSNEPVQALGTGITLDQPLAKDHDIHAVVRDPAVTTAGYQGPPAPNQWFGGPALAPTAGSMVLRDAAGLVVDSLNYGLIVDPWAAEGYQALSGAGASGCSVASPGPPGRGGFPGAQAQSPAAPNRSSGRFPDGTDTDSNCNDFHMQTVTTLAAPAAAGVNNIKVASVADFAPGQIILIGTGANQETAIIASVGTQGASTLRTAIPAGVTVIPLASSVLFTPGQTITIDTGRNLETAVVVASTGPGRGGFGGGRGGQPAGASVTVAAPLSRPHEAGVPVSGSGITIMGHLTKAHESGEPVANGAPTPGAPNHYYARRR